MPPPSPTVGRRGPELSLLGDSPRMRDVRDLVRRVASTPASTVLVTGESGTGKDLVAHAIHAVSARRNAPFTNITCTALVDSLLESELFGHERGAFTDAKQRKCGLLEESDGGTVFLDEVGDMQPTLQAKLLRFLEEKSFRRVGGRQDIHPDVRVIAATNRDLYTEVKTGRFREDLFYRLSVLHIHLPPLREREQDIGLLAEHLIRRFGERFDKRVRGASTAALAVLESHAWPGNVRELRNVVERAVLLCEGDELDPQDFSFGLTEGCAGDDMRHLVLPAGGLDMLALERDLLVQALVRTRGNQSRAGALLGMNRDQVRYRCEKFQLDVETYKHGARGTHG